MLLLGMGTTIYAQDEITSYEPDEAFTDVATLKEKTFAMVQGEKALYVSDAQNLGFDEFSKAFAATSAAVYYKLIDVPEADADEQTAGCYLIRTYTMSGDEYHTWGDGANGFLNSQDAGGWCSFVISAGANGHKLGQDIDYGAVWEVQYVAEKGFTLKNIGTGLYLNNAGTANNAEPAYWNFCTLKENKVVNPIVKGSYDATDANISFFANFGPIADGAVYDADTKLFTGNCGWTWAEGADFDKYQYIVITVAQNVVNKGCQVHIKDAAGMEISGDQYGASFMNLWIGAWNNHNCLKIDLEKLRSEKMFDIHHVAEILIEAGDGLILGNAYATNQVPKNDKNWNDEDNGDFKAIIQNNTYATICLPFEASVAGAYVYEIAGKNDDGIELNMFNGILEPGKPYIYKSNENESGNVYFYKATAATAEVAGENNGLIGSFSGIASEEYLIVKDNKIDQGAVAANTAYIDLDKISGDATEATIEYTADVKDIATAIKSLNKAALNGAIFNVAGQQIKNLQKGINIVDGAKVYVK